MPVTIFTVHRTATNTRATAGWFTERLLVKEEYR